MKTNFFLILALSLSLFACENQEIEYDDFGSTSVYFPFQTPARSLILGDYELGFNDNDILGRFEIGMTMTGVYTNDINRTVHYRVAPELLDGVANVQALPVQYYTIEAESPITIPAGSIKGRIPVQLTDEFFDDELSFADFGNTNYVIPLLITKIEGLDYLLTGEAIVENPNRYNADHWKVQPKDYTLFGIKFMNRFQGIYLRRGVDKKTDETGQTVETVYHADYVEQDELATLTTSGKDNVRLANIIRRGDDKSTGSVNIELAFDEDGNCIVSSYDGDTNNVSGSGKIVEDGDMWGGKTRDVIYLNYSYTNVAPDPANKNVMITETHVVNDTLVIRDRDVKFEEFSIELN